MSAKIIILEEAAYIKPKTIKTICFPLMQVGYCTTIAITSPESQGHFLNRLMEIRWPNGETIFAIEQDGMSCEACMKLQKPCTHKLGNLPDHKPPEGLMKVDLLMADDPEFRDRELRGVVHNTKRFIISRDQIAALRDRAPFEFTPGKPDVLYTGIDPSGAGTGSHYVIITVALDGSTDTPVVRL